MENNVVIPGSIGYFLIKTGKITEVQLFDTLDLQQKEKGLLGNLLVRLGYCSEDDIAKALAAKTGCKFVSIDDIGVSVTAANLIPTELAVKNGILPLYQDDRVLYVAMKNPNDVVTRDNLSLMTGGLEIVPVVTTDAELSAAIENYVNATSNINQFSKEEEEEDAELQALEEAGVDEKPAVQLVNQIINNAVKAGASDIHIEPMEKAMRVRYRIDGVLHEIFQNPIRYHAAVVSRIKVIGGMDIAERRIPQDGRATVKIEGVTFDIRIAMLPSVYGEKCVMRLLERSSKSVQLKDIKFSKAQQKLFREAISLPYGFVLVTGPTGSGKSTTLYATLSEVSDITRHVITLEDPVERRMEGLCQVQMNTRAGMTFSAALRSVLRADPDIVMVGEIRDGETAKIAVESALTGHMVFSTLHTNDSSGAITRLDEMGVEPFLTASSVVGVLAQRLVRVLCTRCKQAYTMTLEETLNLIPDFPVEDRKPGDILTFYRPKGCITCNNTGYKGRMGVFEFLRMTEPMRELVLKRASSAEIKTLAVKEGMHTLRREGLDKAIEGSTSVEEILRVIV